MGVLIVGRFFCWDVDLWVFIGMYSSFVYMDEFICSGVVGVGVIGIDGMYFYVKCWGGYVGDFWFR